MNKSELIQYVADEAELSRAKPAAARRAVTMMRVMVVRGG